MRRVLMLAVIGIALSGAAGDPDLPAMDPHAAGARIGAPPQLLASTDRPLYQPGQTIRYRGLLVDGAGAPLSGQQVEVRVHDPAGDPILSRRLVTSAGGVVSGELGIAAGARCGSYRLQLASGALGAELAVEVRAYRLPRALVTLELDSDHPFPGSAMAARVRALRPWGAPAPGRVTLSLHRAGDRASLDRKSVALDAGGAALTLRVPPDLEDPTALELRAHVEDAAGPAGETVRRVTVARRMLDVELVPATRWIVPGVETDLWCVVRKRDGTPVPGARVQIDGRALPATDAHGLTSGRYRPAGPECRPRVVVTGAGPFEAGPAPLLLSRETAAWMALRLDGTATLDTSGFPANLRFVLHESASGREVPAVSAVPALGLLSTVPATHVSFDVLPAALPSRFVVSVVNERFGPLSIELSPRELCEPLHGPLIGYAPALRLLNRVAGLGADAAAPRLGRRVDTADHLLIESEGAAYQGRTLPFRVRSSRRNGRVRVVATDLGGRAATTMVTLAGGTARGELAIPADRRGPWLALSAVLPARDGIPVMDARTLLMPWSSYRLSVRADRTGYSVRDAAQVEVALQGRDGSKLPPLAAAELSILDPALMALAREAPQAGLGLPPLPGGIQAPVRVAGFALADLVDDLASGEESAQRRANVVSASLPAPFPLVIGPPSGSARPWVVHAEDLRWVLRVLMPLVILALLGLVALGGRPDTDKPLPPASRAHLSELSIASHVAAAGAILLDAGRAVVAGPLAGVLGLVALRAIGVLRRDRGPRVFALDVARAGLAVALGCLAMGHALETCCTFRADPAFWPMPVAVMLSILVGCAEAGLVRAPSDISVVNKVALVFWPNLVLALVFAKEDVWGLYLVAAAWLNIGLSNSFRDPGEEPIAVRLGSVLTTLFIVGVLSIMGVSKYTEMCSEGPRPPRASARTDHAAPVRWNLPLPPSGASGAAREPRRWFPETLYYEPELALDAAGVARTHVRLADSVTRWRARATAVAPGGAIVRGSCELPVVQDLVVGCAVPPRLLVGDRVRVTALVERRSEAAVSAEVEVQASGDIEARCLVAGPVVLDGRTTAVPLEVVARRAGSGTLGIRVRAGGAADHVRHSVTVEPRGVPVLAVQGVPAGDAVELPLRLPDGWLGGLATLRVHTHPISYALGDLATLLRAPAGCFEQVSSTTHPNVLVLAHLRRIGKRDAPEARRARELAREGLQRLLAYEVSGGGFSLYGHSPADLWLTAYGLLEISDLVRELDLASASARHPAVERTARWLLDRREASGLWGGSHELSGMVLWALREAGETGPRIAAAQAALVAALGRDADSIALALGALGSGDPSLCERLAARVRPDATWATQGSPWLVGPGAHAETLATALAAQALSAGGQHAGLAAAAQRALVGRRSPGGAWGSTWVTVHALRALVLTAQKAATAPVHVESGLGSNPPRSTVIDPTGHHTVPVDLPLGSVPAAVPGTLPPVLHLARRGGDVAAEVVLEGRKNPDARGAGVLLELDVRAPRSVERGAVVPLAVDLEWQGGERSGALVIELPLPAGFSVAEEELERMRTAGLIDHHEVRASGLAFYLSNLHPHRPVQLSVPVVAEVSGQLAAQPARAFAYYQPAEVAYGPALEMEVR